MKEELSIDIIGLAGACSYALDCIEMCIRDRTCPLREEKSFSQRAFSIYTDIRKMCIRDRRWDATCFTRKWLVQRQFYIKTRIPKNYCCLLYTSRCV